MVGTQTIGERIPMSQSQKKEAIAQATEQELASLAARGVRIAGNACSPIVLGGLGDGFFFLAL